MRWLCYDEAKLTISQTDEVVMVMGGHNNEMTALMKCHPQNVAMQTKLPIVIRLSN